MQTSFLPTNLAVLFLILLLGSPLISSCTSKQITQTFGGERSRRNAEFFVNINTAKASELESLPDVGPGLAKKIIGHRETYGPFRRPEHLLVIDGLSEKRFLKFRQFIKTE